MTPSFLKAGTTCNIGDKGRLLIFLILFVSYYDNNEGKNKIGILIMQVSINRDLHFLA